MKIRTQPKLHLDAAWNEAYSLYLRGRVLIEMPKGPHLRKPVRRVNYAQPWGYGNQVRDPLHTHPRRYRGVSVRP